MDLNNKVKESINELKSKAEKLITQLEFTAADTADEFEIQKEKLKKWIDKNDIDSETFKHKTDEAKKEINKTIEELQVQLSLGKAEGEEAIRKQSKIIKEKINILKNDIEKDEKLNSLKKDASLKFNELVDTFEILNLKLQYDVEDGKELWEEKKKEINKEIEKWSAELEDLKHTSSDKIENISKEISQTWNKFRKSF